MREGVGVYFAIAPDAEAAGRIVGLARDLRLRHGLTGRLYAPDRLHISLQGLPKFEDLSEAFIARAAAAIARVRVSAFELTLDRAGTWGRGDKPPFVLWSSDGDSPVRSLHGALAAGVVGLSPPLPAYAPHMTLLYDRRAAPETELEEPVTLAVRDIVLIRSHFGQGRQEQLHRWPLPE